ncbi:MAG: 16S rRNA (adenine(1518)-N(6)/adenine(1519)-N(6))-dimethyltransferase RsmA [bacterium]
MLYNETIDVLKRHNIRLKKDLSQNFLIDRDIKDKIIEELGLKESDTVFEIGGGIGIISKEIAPKVDKLISCEIDPNLIPILKKNLESFKNAEIIEKDILKIDLSLILKDKAKVFGSLPYHITTPIILHLLKFKSYITSCFLIVQYDVAKRIISCSGRDYGMLSILLQIYTKPEIVIKISPESFIPRPKPSSALIKLNFLEKPQIVPSPNFGKIVETLFSQRRKKIINSLLKLKIPKETLLSLLKEKGISPDARPLELSIFDISKIASQLQFFLAKPPSFL